MKNILITGASSAIGQALILGLADAGAGVIAHCHTGSAKLEALRASHPGLGGLRLIQSDLRTDAGVEALIGSVREFCPFPDQIVHLPARKLMLRRVTETDWEPLRLDLELQLKSILTISQAFLPAMSKAETRAKIVFMLSSVTCGVPPKFMCAYTVAKYAQLGLMRSLAAEYGQTRVNINAVSPSMVESPFLSEIPQKYVEMAAAQSPGKRNAQPGDVVPAILFLLSPGSDFINGVNLPVTAGMQY
jgi:3-oxoacyl-[acyl-carrier protein] reductase